MKHYDFCIIGAGVVGNAIARELAKFDLSIAVLDAANDVAMGCTKANSGILHGGYDSKHGTLKAQLEYRGNKLYTQWNEELQFGIDRCGSYVIAFSDAQLQTLNELEHNGIQNGVDGLAYIDKDALLELEPNINPNIVGALYCKHSGILSPYEVAIALAENAAANGVEYFLQHKVHNINPIDGAVHSAKWQVETAQHTFYTTYLINSAGVHADEIAAMAGVYNYSTIPRMGSYYIFRFGYMPVSHVLFQAPTKKGKGVLVSPTYHGNLLIGPDVNAVANKDDTRPREESLGYIYNAAKQSIPSLDLTKAIRSYAGIRPTAPNRDFAISMDKPYLLNLVGIDSPGLTCAPAIAEYVVRLLAKASCTLQRRTDFVPTRTALIERQKHRVTSSANGSTAGANSATASSVVAAASSQNPLLPMKEVVAQAALPEGDPNRMVCRCEQVREKTIVEAMERKPKCISIDGVKRRTRASMGICQGKYCRPLIKKLLASKYSMDAKEISEQ